MSEETQTASQPQESAAPPATQGTTPEYGSFLGTEPDSLDTPAEERPETSAEETPEAEEEAAPAESEEEEVAEVEAAEETEEEAEQPPSVTERLKDLTPRELEQYQQRYPTAWKMLNDANQPDDVKHLLLDKIDGDREIQERMAAESATEEPTLEDDGQQTAAATTAPDAAKQRETYYQNLGTLVARAFDQQAVKQVGDTLLSMFNVDVNRLNDPNMSPEDKAELQGLVNSVQKGAPQLATFMADAVNTTLPHVIQQSMELVMPGITQMYEKHMYGTQWDSVRNQVDESGKAPYAALPAFGTKEFSTVMHKAAAQIPGFDNMVMRGQDGNPLPLLEQTRAKYEVLAKIATGQRVSPAVVAQAVATGKRLAGQADRKRQAGRALGAGQPTNKQAFGEGAGEQDPMLAALDAEISRHNTDLRPVSGSRSRG
jgi:hypothetical protein